jgi:hypothetical protein
MRSVEKTALLTCSLELAALGRRMNAMIAMPNKHLAIASYGKIPELSYKAIASQFGISRYNVIRTAKVALIQRSRGRKTESESIC